MKNRSESIRSHRVHTNLDKSIDEETTVKPSGRNRSESIRSHRVHTEVDESID